MLSKSLSIELEVIFYLLAPKDFGHSDREPSSSTSPKTDRQNIPVAATRPQNIHILSQALSRELKILRIKYLKYSNISCVTPRCCTLSQSNTINNIELLFMEFTSYLHPSNIPLSWTLKFAVDQY